MARQDGIIKLKGRVGDLSFYKTKDGYLARSKGGVDGSRIQTDAAYARTRENGAEFGRAGSAGKVLRDSLRGIIKNGSDSRMVARLTSAMVRVVKADQTSARGQRNVLDGELELLRGFEFNLNAKLGGNYRKQVEATIERASGVGLVNFGEVNPAEDFFYPSGATHVKLMVAAAEVDFEENTYLVNEAEPFEAELQPTASPMALATVELSANFTAGTTKPIFVVASVEYYQQVNGELYSLNNGQFNSVTLVEVSGIA